MEIGWHSLRNSTKAAVVASAINDNYSATFCNIDPLPPQLLTFALQKMIKIENIKAVIVVGSITFLGHFLLIEILLLSSTLFPTRTLLPDVSILTDETSVASAFKYVTFIHDVVPSFVVGSIIGISATLLLPRRSVSLLILPSVIIFIGNVVFQHFSVFSDDLIKDWSWLFSSFLPLWASFFIGTAIAVVIGKKLRASNKHGTTESSEPPTRPESKFT